MIFDVRNMRAQTLVWWSKNRNKIDMEPPYQRKGRLWSSSDKAYLVDSIVNRFDVPKLYMADFQLFNSTLNKKRLPYAIIDGKQRLEAIFDFFDGEVVLNDDFIFRDEPSLKLGGLGLRDLRSSYPTVADAFEQASLDIMSVVTDSEELINELFVRLNRSKPLTGAEVRNAVTGPVSKIIKNISKHDFFKENIRFSVTRGEDLNTAGKLLLFEYKGELVSTKKTDLDQFARDKKIDRKALELAGVTVFENLTTMQEIFLPRDVLLSSSGMIPVYYWLVRESDLKRYHLVREFLQRFEEARKLHRAAQKEQAGPDLNQLLARFDTLNRSTNDAGSHSGRVDILQQAFVRWQRRRHSDDTLGIFRP